VLKFFLIFLSLSATALANNHNSSGHCFPEDLQKSYSVTINKLADTNGTKISVFQYVMQESRLENAFLALPYKQKWEQTLENLFVYPFVFCINSNYFAFISESTQQLWFGNIETADLFKFKEFGLSYIEEVIFLSDGIALIYGKNLIGGSGPAVLDFKSKELLYSLITRLRSFTSLIGVNDKSFLVSQRDNSPDAVQDLSFFVMTLSEEGEIIQSSSCIASTAGLIGGWQDVLNNQLSRNQAEELNLIYTSKFVDYPCHDFLVEFFN